MSLGVPVSGAEEHGIFRRLMIKSEAFTGLVLQQGFALLDTGAQYGVSGTAAFKKLEQQSRKHIDEQGQPLQCTRVDGPTSTRGIGGSAKVKFCALVPCGLGYKTSGLFMMLVLDDGNCPTLFPTGLCYQLGVVQDTIPTQPVGRKSATKRLHVELTGYTSLNICELNPTR